MKRSSGHREDTPAGVSSSLDGRLCDVAARVLSHPHEPPDLSAARRAASRGNEAAAMGITKWEKARAAKRRIAAVANRSRIADYELTPGKIQVRAFEVGDSRVKVDGRSIRKDWKPDPQKLQRALDACGRHRGIHRKGERLGTHVYGCGQALCPDCARRRGTKRAGAMLPVISHLVSKGYQVAQLTTTQVVGNERRRPVVLLSDAERKHHLPALDKKGIETSFEGWAVSGEPLGEALDRHRDSHERMRDGRAIVDTGEESRAWWKRTVRAFVQGIEWTGKAPGGFLRWHVHSHMVIVLAPDVDISLWFETFSRRWAEVSEGALEHAQDLSSATGKTVEQAVFHSLKYPFKPASLTHAQILEVMAAAKGRRFNHVGGAFHSRSKIGKAVSALLEGEGVNLEEFSRPDRELVVDLVEAQKNTDLEPVEIAYRRREVRVETWIDASGNRVTSHIAEGSTRAPIVIDGEAWVAVTLSYLASKFLAGEKVLPEVIWRAAEGLNCNPEPVSISNALFAASTYGQVDGPPLDETKLDPIFSAHTCTQEKKQ